MVLLRGNNLFIIIIIIITLLDDCRVQISARTPNINVSRGLPQSPKQMPEQ
jgi:hypothetical protein